MQAWQLDDAAVPPAVVLAEVPKPAPGPGEVLIRVCAAGVTPTELRWYPTTHTKEGAPRSRAIPGHEFSGTVAALGAGTGGIEAGAGVFGMNDWFADGATAGYCLSRVQWIALKPVGLSHTQAAAVPIGALTAWQGLLDRAKLQRGERVLIHGGSGAVGIFAVQLARRQGAHVIATGSAWNEAFLRELGVAEFMDYRAGDFAARVRQVDVVFDTVGGETLERSWAVLGPRGRMVTIAAGEGPADERTKAAFFIVEPKGAQLAQIAELLHSGELVPVLDAVVPFSQTGAAYAGAVTPRARRGKVVISVPGGG